MKKMNNHGIGSGKSHFKNISNRRSKTLDKGALVCYNIGVMNSQHFETLLQIIPPGILAMMMFEDHSRGARQAEIKG